MTSLRFEKRICTDRHPYSSQGWAVSFRMRGGEVGFHRNLLAAIVPGYQRYRGWLGFGGRRPTLDWKCRLAILAVNPRMLSNRVDD
jgi:hypothetical protein